MLVYISGLITQASTLQDAFAYFDFREKLFRSYGYKTLNPMTGKDRDKLLEIGVAKPEGYILPVSTNHAIIERDRWMVSICDVLYCSLLKAPRTSIGCTMELAWAHDRGKHTVLVMEEDNVHQHAFIREAADILFTTEEEAFDYMKYLVEGVK